MAEFKKKLVQFNTDFHDLPRRTAIVVGTCLLLYLFKLAFPYVSPFVFSFLVAALIEPLVKRIAHIFHEKKAARIVASAILILLVYGIILALAIVLVNRVLVEGKTIITRAPDWISAAYTAIMGWVDKIKQMELPISPEIMNSVTETITNEYSQIATKIAGFALDKVVPVTSFAVGKALSLPEIILYLVLMVMGTYYFSADRKQIFASVAQYFPKKLDATANVMKNGFIVSIVSQIKAAILMMVVIWVECSIGFWIIGVDAPIFWAVLIGIADALPIIGAGLFLIPMVIYGFVFGNYMLGIGAAVIYLVVTISRQVLQPKVLSSEMGLHPLLTMMAMYAGYKIIGVAGMLVGPIVALVCKAMFAINGSETSNEPEQPTRTARKRLARERKKNAQNA